MTKSTKAATKKFVCQNAKCKVLTVGALSAGRGVVKEFKHLGQEGQPTPCCISCDKPMTEVK